MTTGRHRRSFVRLSAAISILLVTAACTAAPTQPAQERPDDALPALCAEQPGPERPPGTISTGNRASRLIAPQDYDPTKSYPLLVSLHPFALDQNTWESYSNLADSAAQRGYWVLLPRGSEPGPRWSVPGGLVTGYDDIGWIEKLVQHTAREVCVDGERVFAAGFSAGAAMSVGLGCELPWRFSAIAASGGSNLTSLCPDSAGVDALLIHGSADPIAPLSGSTVIFAPPLGLPVADVVDSFRVRNGCDSVSTVQLSATVARQVHECSTDRLEYWEMAGAGHTWAGTAPILDPFVGATDQSFSATESVLDFFDAG